MTARDFSIKNVKKGHELKNKVNSVERDYQRTFFSLKNASANIEIEACEIEVAIFIVFEISLRDFFHFRKRIQVLSFKFFSLTFQLCLYISCELRKNRVKLFLRVWVFHWPTSSSPNSFSSFSSLESFYKSFCVCERKRDRENARQKHCIT